MQCVGLEALEHVKVKERSVPVVKVRKVLRRLREDGWVQTAHSGSHRQFEHPTKPGKVTVPGSPSDDLPPGTLRSILRQAGLEG